MVMIDIFDYIDYRVFLREFYYDDKIQLDN